MEVQLRLPGD